MSEMQNPKLRKMNSRRRNPPWEDLPSELLSAIANFLTSNPIDILIFRSVCKSWYSSSPPPSPYNLSLMLPLTLPHPGYTFDSRFFQQNLGLPILSVTSIFALRRQEEDPKCWLMFVNQLTPGKFMIRQPLTKCHYSMPINFPTSIDVSNIHHVEEISRFYNLSFHPAVNKPPSIWSEYVQKVLVNSDESRTFVLFNTGQVGTSLLRKYPLWDASDLFPVYLRDNDDASDRIDDIVYHDGKVLGVDRVGRLYDVSLSGSYGGKLIVHAINGSSTKRKRLVESNGVIYLVVRESVHQESDGGVRFKVFELDEVFDLWVEVTSVGDMVLLFGDDFSFSVSPHKLGGSFKKNCIIYIENSFKDYDGFVDDDTIFSNLRYGDLRVGVWHMDDPFHCSAIGSYPGYSSVLWPPPTCLWHIDMSKRIGDLEAALNDLLVNVPARKLKAMSKKQPALEQAIVVDDIANKRDISEIWKAIHRVQVYLNKAKEIHKHSESIKTENCLFKQQARKSTRLLERAESSSGGTEVWQGSVNSAPSDDFISRETKLHSILLHLEETVSKLQNVTLLRRSTRVRKS